MNFIFKITILFIFELSYLNAKSELKTNQSPISSIVKVYSQTISYNIPINFFSTDMKLPNGSRQENKSNFLLEIVPYNQTLDNWKEMITISGTKDMSIKSDTSSEDLMNFFKSRFEQSCSDTFSYLFLEEKSNENEKSFVVSCGNINGKNESTLIKTVKGEKDFYTIQWAFHNKLSNKPINLNKQEWLNKLNALNPIVLNQ